MSLIDQEMANIQRSAAQINASGVTVYADAGGARESLLQDREKAQLFEHDIFEFSFDNPLELKAQLTRMWEQQQCGYMLDFIDVCLVSAFKHRPRQEDFNRETPISAFVYEF